MATTRTKLFRFLTWNLRPGSSAFNFNGSMRSDPFYCSFSSSSSAAAVAPQRDPIGLEVLGVKDYEDYRRSLYGEITHKALLVDAVGTLLAPSQPMAQVFLFYLHFTLHFIAEHVYACQYKHVLCFFSVYNFLCYGKFLSFKALSDSSFCRNLILKIYRCCFYTSICFGYRYTER